MKESLSGGDVLWGNDRYRIEEQIGSGAMGVVYRAHDLVLDAPVAIKTVRTPDPATLYRLKHEFRVLADLSHPNVLGIRELSVHEGRWFLAMELLEGSELEAYLMDRAPATSGIRMPPVNRTGLLSSTEDPEVPSNPVVDETASMTLRTIESDEPANSPANDFADVDDDQRGQLEARLPEPPVDLGKLLQCLPQLVEAVHSLHSAGLLHRDIKPSNVMVTTTGRLVLFDFGVSGLQDAEEEAIVGTPAFMAPEVLRREAVGTYTDWYAVGASLYQLITGKSLAAFRDDLWAAPETLPPPPSSIVKHVPNVLQEVCMGLLHVDHAQRFGYEEVCSLLGMEPTRGRLGGRGNHNEFAGRRSQAATLTEAFARARRGDLTAVTVSGPSGMGKSALLEHFIASLPDTTLVFRGRCFASERLPYKGFDAVADALAAYLRMLPEDERERLLPRTLPSLATLFPVFQEVVSERVSYDIALDPHVVRREAFDAFRELLSALADRHPVVLHLDDVQWSDEDSAALLTALLNGEPTPSILLVASHRDDLDSSNTFIQTLSTYAPRGESSALEPIQLGPLTDAEANELIDAIPERDVLSGDARDQIVREAGGSPFFLRELVYHYLENQDATLQEATLDALIEKRTARLNSQARELLETIALFGRPQSVSRLSRLHQMGAEQGRVIHELRVARLVTVTPTSGEERVECYHDRIRETVADRIPQPERRGRHLDIARALQTSDSGEFDLLAEHFAAAGDTENAARYVREAADEAMRALAFERAVELYTQALEYASEGSQEHLVLRRCLADALVHVGRNGDAASHFLALASETEGAEHLEHLRLAAQYRIANGDIEQGLELLEKVMSDAGESIPATPRKALGRLAWARMRLAIRGYEFSWSPSNAVDERERAAIDVCWSAGLTLVWVDNFRSAYFLARCLLRALAAGDPFRVARALCLETGFLSVKGESTKEKVLPLLRRAETLAAELDDPYLKVFIPLTQANYHFQVSSDFTAGLAAAEQALSRLREHPDLAYERATSSNYAMWFLYYMGRPKELRRRALEVVADAEARGDRYALNNTLAGLPSFHWLATDEPERAREGCNTVLGNWGASNGALMQYYYGVFGLAQVELYDGNAIAAFDLVCEAWPRLKRAMILRIDMAFVPMSHLRARAALAAARQADDPNSYLADARRTLKSMRGRTAPLKVVMRTLIEAELRVFDGDVVASACLFEEAEKVALKQELFLFGMSARVARGRLIGGKEGETLVASAEAGMSARGVARPDRIAALYVPAASRQES